MNNTFYGNINGPVNTGRIEGDQNAVVQVSSSSHPLHELLSLLAQLRTEIAKQQPPTAEVIETELNELTKAAARSDGAAARSRWEGIKALLTNVSEVSEIAVKIGTALHQLFA